MKPVGKALIIRAPINAVWSALASASTISAWMHDSSVILEPHVGGKLSLFGGETMGTVREVNEPTRLVYGWRMAEWPADWADSEVRWNLRSSGEMTFVQLEHDGFPNVDERDGHDTGWDEYWLAPMRAWLEATGDQESMR